MVRKIRIRTLLIGETSAADCRERILKRKAVLNKYERRLH